jgi:membrane-bound lytic murein transglycosylase D
MRKNAFFKFALVAASLLLVASCSSSPEKAAETTASSSVQSAKLKKHRHNPWQQGYEDDLNITQNTLPNASALKKKISFPSNQRRLASHTRWLHHR